MPVEDSRAVATLDEIQPVRALGSKNAFNNSPMRLTMCPETLTLRTRSDSAKTCIAMMIVFDLHRDRE